jgi:hypothetical protein
MIGGARRDVYNRNQIVIGCSRARRIDAPLTTPKGFAHRLHIRRSRQGLVKVDGTFA